MYKKALFSQRLGAFIVDIILVSIFSTFITMIVPVSDAANKLYEQQDQIMERYINNQANIEEYVNNMIDISYDIAKETGVITIVSVVISLLYFVVIPMYKDGQTLGKKLLKIKIVKSNDTELSMNDLLFRAFLNTSILVNIISVCLVFFASKQLYLSASTIISGIWYIVIISSAFMVAFSKNRQGIHDKIAHTEVVMLEKIKEEVVCES